MPRDLSQMKLCKARFFKQIRINIILQNSPKSIIAQTLPQVVLNEPLTQYSENSKPVSLPCAILALSCEQKVEVSSREQLVLQQPTSTEHAEN